MSLTGLGARLNLLALTYFHLTGYFSNLLELSVQFRTQLFKYARLSRYNAGRGYYLEMETEELTCRFNRTREKFAVDFISLI